MYERTDDARWKELFLRSFEPLWEQWTYADEARCHLWSSSLYGVTEMRIGALHGFAANAYVMLRGRRLLKPAWAAEMLRRIHETVHATALIEGPHANWPNNVGPTTRSAPLAMVVQHCNGAPGIITCLAEFPNDARWPIDGLLRQAGDLVWAAGPTIKLPSLVPRRRRQRLRVPEVVCTHGRRRVARSRTQICDACDRTVRSRRQKIRPTEVFAMDRRPGPRDLSVGLCQGDREIPDSRCLLIVDRLPTARSARNQN